MAYLKVKHGKQKLSS